MDEPKPTCETCFFYSHAPLQPIGECCEGPPQMIPVMQGGAPGLIPVRPQVPKGFNCGRYVWKDHPEDPPGAQDQKIQMP